MSEKSRKFYGDVLYDVWRSGGDCDAVSRDECEDMRHEGMYADEAADTILRHERRIREQSRPQEEEPEPVEPEPKLEDER